MSIRSECEGRGFGGKVLALLGLILLVSGVGLGQSESGSAAVEGTISAPDGQPLAQAKVETRNQETGYTQSLITSDCG